VGDEELQILTEAAVLGDGMLRGYHRPSGGQPRALSGFVLTYPGCGAGNHSTLQWRRALNPCRWGSRTPAHPTQLSPGTQDLPFHFRDPHGHSGGICNLVLQWVFQKKLGLCISGVLYNLLQKSNPYDVKILSSGLPSKDKSQSTIPEVYLSVLHEAIKDFPDARQEQVYRDYYAHVDYLRNSAPPLYQRELISFSDAELDSVIRTFDQEIPHLLDLTPDTATPHLNRFRCARCEMKIVCQMMDNGGDYLTYLKGAFTNEAQVPERDSLE